MKVYIKSLIQQPWPQKKKTLASEGYKTSRKKKIDSFHEKYITITQKFDNYWRTKEEKNDCTHSHYMHTQINDKQLRHAQTHVHTHGHKLTRINKL